MNLDSMKPGISSRRSAPEQRVVLMRELAQVLTQAQAAVLAWEVEELQIQTARQETLCQTLRRLGQGSGDSLPLGAGISARPGGENVSAENGPARELQALGLQVRYLNRVQAALLRRARRSLAILACLQARSQPTYTPPASTLAAGSR
jgi:flagellar biosynthesis/type III secretory pathway chaperone